jgi:hypothetical protein
MDLFHRNLWLSLLRLCDRRKTEFASANQITEHKRNFPAVAIYMWVNTTIIHIYIPKLNKPAPRTFVIIGALFYDFI